MDIGTVLNAMRDPAGVPAHPVLFQALMVITWLLHIAFVHLTLGCAGCRSTPSTAAAAARTGSGCR
jgi:hypothetical protein